MQQKNNSLDFLRSCVLFHCQDQIPAKVITSVYTAYRKCSRGLRCLSDSIYPITRTDGKDSAKRWPCGYLPSENEVALCIVCVLSPQTNSK
jgi:hypothetical protein